MEWMKLFGLIVGSGGLLGVILGFFGRWILNKISYKSELNRTYLVPFKKWCAETYGELLEFWRSYKSSVPPGTSDLEIVIDYCYLHEALAYAPRWTIKIPDDVRDILWKIIHEVDTTWHNIEQNYQCYIHDRESVIKLFQSSTGLDVAKEVKDKLPYKFQGQSPWKKDEIEALLAFLEKEAIEFRRRRRT
jgi:hypothetical protein